MLPFEVNPTRGSTTILPMEVPLVPHTSLTPFDTIESAQDFVALLNETIIEARKDIEVDFNRELDCPPSRHRDALQIALYSLERLEKHMTSSRRILNDLRSLRRLLFAERQFHRVKALGGKSAEPETPPSIVALIPPPKRVGIPVASATVTARRSISA